MKFKDTKQRSIAKAITLRSLIILSDLVIVYAVTRQISATIEITVLINAVSYVLSFLRKRAG